MAEAPTPKNPKADAPAAAPITPTAAPKPEDTGAKLAAAKAELEQLKAEKELELVHLEIEKLKHGGLSPYMIGIRKKQEVLREATLKETQGDGKVLAVYMLPEKSFRDGQLRDPGHIVKLPVDKLPAPTWKPVERTQSTKKVEYHAVG